MWCITCEERIICCRDFSAVSLRQWRLFKSLINSARDLSSFEWATLNDLRNYAKLNQPLTRAAQDLYWESELAGVSPPSSCSWRHSIFLWIQLVFIYLFYFFNVLKLLLIAADCLCLWVYMCLELACMWVCVHVSFPLNAFSFPRWCRCVICNLFAGVYLSHLAEGHRIRWQLAGSHSRVCVCGADRRTHTYLYNGLSFAADPCHPHHPFFSYSLSSAALFPSHTAALCLSPPASTFML